MKEIEFGDSHTGILITYMESRDELIFDAWSEGEAISRKITVTEFCERLRIKREVKKSKK